MVSGSGSAFESARRGLPQLRLPLITARLIAACAVECLSQHAVVMAARSCPLTRSAAVGTVGCPSQHSVALSARDCIMAISDGSGTVEGDGSVVAGSSVASPVAVGSADGR